MFATMAECFRLELVKVTKLTVSCMQLFGCTSAEIKILRSTAWCNTRGVVTLHIHYHSGITLLSTVTRPRLLRRQAAGDSTTPEYR